MTGSSFRLSPPVAAAIARGNKIEAIKLLREETGLGLAESKNLVEAFAKQTAASAAREDLAAAWSETVQATSRRRPSIFGGLAPGEEPRSLAGLGWWIAAGVVAAALVAWFLLRR